LHPIRRSATRNCPASSIWYAGKRLGNCIRNLFSGLLGHTFVTVTLAKSVDARWPENLPRYMGAGVLLLRGRILFINYSALDPLYTTHRLNI
jgi:hypothetical protein